MAVAVQMLVDTVLMRHSPAEVAVPWLVELHQNLKLAWFLSIFFEDGLVLGFLFDFLERQQLEYLMMLIQEGGSGLSDDPVHLGLYKGG